MVKKDVKSEGIGREKRIIGKSESQNILEVEVKVSEIGRDSEKMRKLGLKFVEKYVKGSVNGKNIKFV